MNLGQKLVRTAQMTKPPERVLVFGHDMRNFLALVRSQGSAGKQMHAALLKPAFFRAAIDIGLRGASPAALFRRSERLARYEPAVDR